MKNYICVEGKKTRLTEAQLTEIRRIFCASGVRLAEVKVGEVVQIGSHEMIVLEQSGDTTALIRREVLFDSEVFGRNNNYKGSHVDALCEAFARGIADEIGPENIVAHTVDLTSDDGLKDYGKIRRKASLLTTALYRRYVEVLDQHPIDKWWWLATPFTTPKHGSDGLVKCVAPSGRVSSISSYYNHYGVRPFCILNSNIFVSK